MIRAYKGYRGDISAITIMGDAPMTQEKWVNYIPYPSYGFPWSLKYIFWTRAHMMSGDILSTSVLS